MQRIALTLAFLAIPFAPGAATPATDAVRRHVATHERAMLGEYEALLAMPNVATDLKAIRANADAIVTLMKARKLAPRILEGADATVPPAVYGERLVPGATRTLVFYAHYDGQPVTPEDWAQDPFTPTWYDGPHDRGGKRVSLPASGAVPPDWRLYARAASDDKAGVYAILTAIAALDAAEITPGVNLKLFFEGEEEQGSPNLRGLLEKHRDTLKSDAWIICDGPLHPSGRQPIVYGVRGDVNVDITVYGPKRPLHSGHYGNWAPNPAARLASLLASMKNDDGRVTVAGWYDDVVPLGAIEARALAEAPQADAQMKAELGLGATDNPGKTLAEAINEPSLNINGIRAADVGDKARNVIMTEAMATLDLRLVKGNTPERQVEKLRAHLAKQGYTVLDRAPTDAERAAHAKLAKLTVVPGGYGAQRAPMDSALAKAVSAAVQASAAQPIVAVPTSGGSLPLIVIKDVLGADAISVPIANHDNNQHAENENLRIGNLWRGVETLAAVMTLRP